MSENTPSQSEMEDDAGVTWFLQQWEMTKNPLYAADVFRLSVLVGRQPPAAVMKWLAAGLSVWTDTEGETTLDKALRLNPGSGARRSHFEDYEREREIERRMLDMDFLIYLGASRDNAALIASDRKREPTRAPLKSPLTTEQLLDRYKGRKHRASDEAIRHWVESSPAWTGEFLDKFGDQYAHLKKQLKSRA